MNRFYFLVYGILFAVFAVVISGQSLTCHHCTTNTTSCANETVQQCNVGQLCAVGSLSMFFEPDSTCYETDDPRFIFNGRQCVHNDNRAHGCLSWDDCFQFNALKWEGAQYTVTCCNEDRCNDPNTTMTFNTTTNAYIDAKLISGSWKTAGDLFTLYNELDDLLDARDENTNRGKDTSEGGTGGTSNFEGFGGKTEKEATTTTEEADPKSFEYYEEPEVFRTGVACPLSSNFLGMFTALLSIMNLLLLK